MKSKSCRNCKWCYLFDTSLELDYIPEGYCLHPKCKTDKFGQNLVGLRGDVFKCGKNGVWFEPREQQENIYEPQEQECTMKKLTIEFDNEKALEHFACWLCESGEQSYWGWMESRECEEETPNMTATSLKYCAEDESLPRNDKKRYGKWLEDNTIRTVCGRLDKEE